MSTRVAADGVVEVLNRLRDSVNAAFGYRKRVPRVNLGPCGRIAQVFCEMWNARFDEKVNITFVMKTDDSGYCYHVVVRLPDGRYYDGGYGVISQRELLALVPAGRIEVMENFDLDLLDRRSYGLHRTYRGCPDYSDDTLVRLIDTHLSELAQLQAVSGPECCT